jgi:type I restriction enzyme S subunit
MQNHTIVVNDGTDMMNDEALKLCNNRSNLEKGDVLFSGTGTIGEVAALEETPTNWNIKEGVYAIKPNPNILNHRFLMYILQSSSIRQAYLKKAAGGTVKSVPMGEMRKLEIPVPSLAEQQRIVDILDRFNTLTTDITAGLPAEIEARRKQYEYYRDQLLTFKQKA